MIDTAKPSTVQRLTEKQVSERYGFARQTLANWRMNRTGPRFYRIGRNVRYDVVDLEQFMSAERVETSGTHVAAS